MFRDLSKKWWLWVLGGAGILLLVISSFGTSKPSVTTGNASLSPSANQDSGVKVDSYTKSLQSQLEAMLGQLPNVQSPRVMITLDSTEEVILAKNQQTTSGNTVEKDTSGGTRTTTNTTTNNQVVVDHLTNGDQPIVERKIAPKVRGVLVMAYGADDPRIQEEILSAVSSVLDVPAFKVTVLPEKSHQK